MYCLEPGSYDRADGAAVIWPSIESVLASLLTAFAAGTLMSVWLDELWAQSQRRQWIPLLCVAAALATGILTVIYLST